MKNKIEGKEKAYIGKERGILYFEREETHNISTPKAKMKVNYTGVREKDKMLMTEKPGEIIFEDKGKECKKRSEIKEKRLT